MSTKKLSITVEVGGRTKTGRALLRLLLRNVRTNEGDMNEFREALEDVGDRMLHEAYRQGYRYDDYKHLPTPLRVRR